MSRFVEGHDRNQVTLLPECLDDYIGVEENKSATSVPIILTIGNSA
jgi:hypothetical protein